MWVKICKNKDLIQVGGNKEERRIILHTKKSVSNAGIYPHQRYCINGLEKFQSKATGHKFHAVMSCLVTVKAKPIRIGMF